ncbi:MAG: ethylbenzene dehydrogenase-related protein [Myxococcota bacterium]|nr:ethylbenzene dehydrogenase-related protein [Myxococcota bacterium]
MIRASFVAAVTLEDLLDPGAGAWRRAPVEAVRLIGTPLGMQPTEAIRVAWRDRPIGAVDRIDVAALHTGRALALRLEWADPEENLRTGDNDQFPDAAAVLFPTVENAPLVTMGTPGMSVTAWYWRADEEGVARQVVAEGIGTSRTVDRELVRARGVWKEGRWAVVLARALQVEAPEPVVRLRPGARLPMGVAVWEGGHGERGGIKAFSPGWPQLELAPAAGARR